MLRIVFSRVHRDKVERLRAWMRELTERADEVHETFEREGTRHEVVYLLEGREGPLLVYAVEAEDPDRAYEAFVRSTLPIDLEHCAVMQAVLEGSAAAELLLDLRGSDVGD